MAVIITDMDMPKGCADCPMCEHEIDDSGYSWNYWCSVTDKTMDINIHMDSCKNDCPLKSADEMTAEIDNIPFYVDCYDIEYISRAKLSSIIHKYTDKE